LVQQKMHSILGEFSQQIHTKMASQAYIQHTDSVPHAL